MRMPILLLPGAVRGAGVDPGGDVAQQTDPLLREDDQGDHIYKDLKDEILNLFGPRDEDAFKKAIALRLTGKPSGLGKKL